MMEVSAYEMEHEHVLTCLYCLLLPPAVVAASS